MNFGESKMLGDLTIFYGKMPVLKMILNRLKGQKIVRWWVGTDADTLNKTPPGSWHWRHLRLPLHRLKTTLTNPFIYQHWHGCSNVHQQLALFGIKAQKLKYEPYPILYKQSDRRRLIVILHIPAVKRNKKYKRWYHGIDLSEYLMEIYHEAYWLIADNNQDMRAYYAVADACVLTKRANGHPRMKHECEINNIPCYYEGSNISIVDILKFLDDLYEQKQADPKHS